MSGATSKGHADFPAGWYSRRNLTQATISTSPQRKLKCFRFNISPFIKISRQMLFYSNNKIFNVKI